MSLLTWVILGAIAGWLASIITQRSQEMSLIINVVVGIAGAIVGGVTASLIGVGGISDFTFSSVGVATLGAILLISIVKAFDNQPSQN